MANRIIEWDNFWFDGQPLIALDKCPGVHPISVGEVLHCTLCKVVADLKDVCGID